MTPFCLTSGAPPARAGPRSSTRWRATQAEITRLHTRVAGARRDRLPKLSTRLVAEFQAGANAA